MEVLRTLLRDTDPGVRAASVESLGRRADGMSDVQQCLTTDADPSVRVAALRALGGLEGGEGMDAEAWQCRFAMEQCHSGVPDSVISWAPAPEH